MIYVEGKIEFLINKYGNVKDFSINNKIMYPKMKENIKIPEHDVYGKGIRVQDLPDNIKLNMCCAVIGAQPFARDDIIAYSLIKVGKNKMKVLFNEGRDEDVEVMGFDAVYYYKRLKDVVIKREVEIGDVFFQEIKRIENSVFITFYSEIESDLLDNVLDFAQEISEEIMDNLRSSLGYNIRYIGGVKNEKELTKEIIIPLLRKLGFINVRYNHGTYEHGRDIIFSRKTEFDDMEYYSAQVKFGDVSGDIRSRQTIELLEQIKQAFEISFRDIYGKTIEGISKLIVIISGKFSKPALDQLNDGLKNNEAIKNNVIFIDRQKLEGLIEKVEHI